MFPNILTGDRVPSDDELDPETISIVKSEIDQSESIIYIIFY